MLKPNNIGINLIKGHKMYIKFVGDRKSKIIFIALFLKKIFKGFIRIEYWDSYCSRVLIVFK